jgi:hypothetical protein
LKRLRDRARLAFRCSRRAILRAFVSPCRASKISTATGAFMKCETVLPFTDL